MLKYVILLIVALCVSAGGKESARHHHKRSVEAHLSGDNLTVTFHAPMAESFDEVDFDVNGGIYIGTQTGCVQHGQHFDWMQTFTATNILPCDEIDIIITGWPTGEGIPRIEFDNEIDLPPRIGGDC